MPDNAWWSALCPDPDGIVRILGIEVGMTVVDLCCGDDCAGMSEEEKDDFEAKIVEPLKR
ncbi:hypothetical protein [Marinobacter sp.]|uniref:hypothetical protein n=1 Tax=Marinobacter sp. TaxID=50741 RepID=UPI003A902510